MTEQALPYDPAMALSSRAAAAPGFGRLPWRAYLPLVPGLLFLFLFLVLPLLATLWLSLSPNVLLKFDGPALDNFTYLLGKPYYLDVLWRTLRFATAATVI